MTDKPQDISGSQLAEVGRSDSAIGNSPKEISPNFGLSSELYGKDFHTHLLEEYKLYVEMADRVSQRRVQVASFYISLLSGLLALLSITGNKELFGGSQKIVLLAISILGLSLCYLWSINIDSYRQLNSLKFKVIHEMEQQLPFPCYEREWRILKEEKNGAKYLRLTAIERYVPFIVSIPYLLLLIYSLFNFVSR